MNNGTSFNEPVGVEDIVLEFSEELRNYLQMNFHTIILYRDFPSDADIGRAKKRRAIDESEDTFVALTREVLLQSVNVIGADRVGWVLREEQFLLREL